MLPKNRKFFMLFTIKLDIKEKKFSILEHESNSLYNLSFKFPLVKKLHH